jgi:Serine aminopeptidase, S33
MKTALACALALIVPLAHSEEIVTLESRAGATQSYLLLAPGSAPPAAVAVLFPGGAGSIRLRLESGQARFGPNNFLVRARTQFVAGGVAVAIVDAPSDQAQGMPNAFRKSESHLQDIRAVVADLKKRYPGAPAFLVGTSMGTVSAAYAGRALGDELAGVVLTSSVFVASGRRSTHGDSNLSDFDYTAIRPPLLFVHHQEDGCQVTPYAAARRQSGRYPLISVSGGSPPQSEPCEALSAHGYLGKETETVQSIVNWMLKKPFAREIN